MRDDDGGGRQDKGGDKHPEIGLGESVVGDGGIIKQPCHGAHVEQAPKLTHQVGIAPDELEALVVEESEHGQLEKDNKGRAPLR